MRDRYINQNCSGLKFFTLLYRATTKPRVGNWHGPIRCGVHKATQNARARMHTIGDNLLFKGFISPLKVEGLEARECRSYPEIQHDASLDSIGLSHVKLDWVLSCVMDLPGAVL